MVQSPRFLISYHPLSSTETTTDPRSFVNLFIYMYALITEPAGHLLLLALFRHLGSSLRSIHEPCLPFMEILGGSPLCCVSPTMAGGRVFICAGQGRQAARPTFGELPTVLGLRHCG